MAPSILRSRRVVLALVAVAVLGVSACGGSDKNEGASGGGDQQPVATFEPSSTMETIQQRGKLIVGTKFDQPLFSKKGLSGDPEGFDVEIAKVMAKGIFGDDIDGKIEYVETPSKVREDSIEQGKVDLIVATYTINDTRKQRVGFAGPYYVAGQDLLVRKDDNSVTGVESLAGKKVCTAPGSTSLTNLQKAAPQADTSLLFDTYSKCVEALKDKRVDAVTTDNVILLGFAADDDSVKVVGKTFSTEPYGIGVKKDDTVFRAFLNDKLASAEQDGTWARLFEEQVGSKAHVATPAPPPIDRY